MKKLVIFDLDGTLVNSIDDLGNSVNYALKQFSLEENTIDEYYQFVGNGMEHLVRSAMKSKGDDNELYSKVRNVFDEYYANHCNDLTCAYEGISQLLARLSESGIETAVLSNKADRYIGNILNKNFPDHKFLAAWGQREGIERKPSGDGLIKMIAELGYSRSECVYVGDSEVDVLTAQNAGVDLICVLWGFRSEQILKDHGADNITDSTDTLFDRIINYENA